MKSSKKKHPLEKNFKARVKRELGSIPGLYHFTKEACSIRGIPDIIGCYKGRFFAWELKRSQKEAAKTTGRIVLQKHNIGKIQICGGIAELVYPENFESKLAELLEL